MRNAATLGGAGGQNYIASEARLARKVEQHPRQHGEHRRFQAERWSVRCQRVELLRATDSPSCIGLGFKKPNLSHAFKMSSDGIRVKP